MARPLVCVCLGLWFRARLPCASSRLRVVRVVRAVFPPRSPGDNGRFRGGTQKDLQVGRRWGHSKASKMDGRVWRYLVSVIFVTVLALPSRSQAHSCRFASSLIPPVLNQTRDSARSTLPKGLERGALGPSIVTLNSSFSSSSSSSSSSS